jgi:hypothetical protein
VAEISLVRTGGNHQLVIADPTVAEQYGATCRIDAGHRVEDHRCVRLSRENAADGRGNVGRRQGRSRNLVQKRLKEVIIAPVDHRHVRRDAAQPQRSAEPAETRADHDDFRPVRPCGRYGRRRCPDFHHNSVHAGSPLSCGVSDR